MMSAVQVLGCGCAGLGVAVAADRIGHFARLARAGMIFVDARSRAAAIEQRLGFLVDSNSCGEDFIKNIRIDGLFEGVVGLPSYLDVARNRAVPVPLLKVRALLSDLYDALELRLRSEVGSSFKYSTRVQSIQRKSDGCYASYDQHGNLVAQSKAVVLALGALENRWNEECVRAKPLLSGQVLRGDYGRVEDALRRGAQVRIIGSSHSAFSVADLLLERFADLIGHGQIAMVVREVRVYHRSGAVAAAEGYNFEKTHVDPESGEIHRFDGLRERAKALFLRVSRGREPRVQLVWSDNDVSQGKDHVSISAVGYRSNTVKITDASGSAIQLAHEHGLARVGNQGELFDVGGQAIPGMYGVGLGYASRNQHGAVRIGINHFHGDVPERIVRRISIV